jgi:hypothetical protein
MEMRWDTCLASGHILLVVAHPSISATGRLPNPDGVVLEDTHSSQWSSPVMVNV